MYASARNVAAAALVCLLIDTGSAMGQVDTDSLRNALRAQMAAERQSIARAAQVFLDVSRSDGERLTAVQGIHIFLATEDLQRANRIALGSNQSVAIRVRAVQLATHAAANDPDVLRNVLATVQNPSTPTEVRRALSIVIGMVMFGSATMQDMMPELQRALRSMTQDSDSLVASRAFSLLAAQGDQPILQAIARSLEARQLPTALDAAAAVALLGLVDPAPWFPALRGVLRDPPDARARLEAIRLLGGDPASHADLIEIFTNSSESTEVRLAALGALRVGLRDLASRVLPVVDDERSPAELRVTAILAVEQQRVSRDQAIRARRPDAFDVAVESLAQRSADPQVRAAATRYMQRTRSPH